RPDPPNVTPRRHFGRSGRCAFRRARGATRVELAERSGIGRVATSNMENGKTTGIDFGTLEKLAGALGVNAAVLIEHAPGEKGQAGVRGA
ncbi:MAG TPA: helix-turn-helix transcriptional regulator, partial [Thermoleophilaceae bacterium]|nr:helix-turn-helix transcriptional regulator [Thermoleophilaceae bacterium]